MRSSHRLFTRYPLDGEVLIAGEVLSTPYHIYNGAMLFFGGTADADVASELLGREGLLPLCDDNGRALAATWVCDFTSSNLGPHHEFQFSLFGTTRPVARQQAHPFALLRALATIRELRMICHGLWNNTRRVVQFNSEHLQLSARLCTSEIRLSGGRYGFRFADAETGTIAEGDGPIAPRQSAAVTWQVMRHVGLAGMLRTFRSPYIHIPVSATRRSQACESLVSDTYTQCDRLVVRRIGPDDAVTITHPTYARLAFTPDFVQHNAGVRMVFSRPTRPYSGSTQDLAAAAVLL